MNRFKIISTLGDHSYGTILKAENSETGEKVVIKQSKKKFYSWEECMSLKEIKVLRILNHSNIVKLKEIIKQKEELYCVYEWTDENLFEWYQNIRDSGKMITEPQIKSIMYQLAIGLQYIHKTGYFHRDLSVENIFINQSRDIKVGCFFAAREINSKPPLTDYITTRWYRAPEQLLHTTGYTYKVDMWALGCIMAELYLLGPLFGGVSEIDQLHKIVKILGSPKDWPDFFSLVNNLKIKINECEGKILNKIINNASPEALDLMYKLLTFNPQKRINCTQMLKHQFFTGQISQNVTIHDDQILPQSQNQEQQIVQQNSLQQDQPKQQQSILKDQEIESKLSNSQVSSSSQQKEGKTGFMSGLLNKSLLQKKSSQNDQQQGQQQQQQILANNSSFKQNKEKGEVQIDQPQQTFNQEAIQNRPVGRDCNRNQIDIGQEIKEEKELEGSIKTDESRDQEEIKEQTQDIQQNLSSKSNQNEQQKQTVQQINPIIKAVDKPEPNIPGLNLKFTGKRKGSVLNSTTPTNIEEAKSLLPPKTPDQPPGLNLNQVINQ